MILNRERVSEPLDEEIFQVALKSRGFTLSFEQNLRVSSKFGNHVTARVKITFIFKFWASLRWGFHDVRMHVNKYTKLAYFRTKNLHIFRTPFLMSTSGRLLLTFFCVWICWVKCVQFVICNNVIIEIHYSLYKLIVTQTFSATVMFLQSLKQVFYVCHPHSTFTMLLLPKVQTKASTS